MNKLKNFNIVKLRNGKIGFCILNNKDYIYLASGDNLLTPIPMSFWDKDLKTKNSNLDIINVYNNTEDLFKSSNIIERLLILFKSQNLELA